MIDHPLVKTLKNRNDNADMTEQELAAGFVHLDRVNRIDALEKLRAHLEADDGTSIREKAQLLTLSRHAHDVHRALTKAGR